MADPAYTDESKFALYMACARAAHEALRAVRQTRGIPALAWEVAPASQRQPFIARIQDALDHDTPEARHGCWLLEMQRLGWSLGEMSHEQMTRPDMVPYDQLDPVRQAEDRLYWNVVRSVYVAMFQFRT